MRLFTNQLSDRLTEELATARKLKVRPITVSDREFESTVNAGTVKWAVTQQKATKLLNCLIEKQATQVQDWLKSIWQGKQHIPENFNWPGLAAVASDKARGSVASSGASNCNLITGHSYPLLPKIG